MLAGVLTAGVLDPSFGQGGLVTTKLGLSDAVGAGALQPDGKIVVAGTVQVSGDMDSTIGLARFLPDGRLDPSFGSAGTGEVLLDPSAKIDEAEAVAVIDHPGQPDDGRIVVAGQWSDSTVYHLGVALVCFTPDGALDTRFGSGGEVLDARTFGGGFALAIQPDDKILVGGANYVSTTTSRGFVERFNTDGTPDTGFADPGVSAPPDGWTFQNVTELAVDPNRGLFVAGGAAVAHLTASGQLDPSFGSHGIATADVPNDVSGADVTGLAVDPTRGLGVMAHTEDSGNHLLVTRFDFQGHLDPSFNQGTVEFVDFQPAQTSPDQESAVAVQPDGKVIIACEVLGVNTGGTLLGGLARLNVDGTLDTSFGTGGKVITHFLDHGIPAHFLTKSVLLQADGNIVVTGTAGSPGGSFALARYLGKPGGTIPSPQPPLVGPITTPSPVLVGTSVSLSASFTYTIPTDQHTAVWDWGDHTTSAGTVTEANGSGTVTGSHVYAATGIYPVTLTVTDQRGASGSATAVPGVVVFELILGGITGSGLINGPPFAVAAAPAGQVRFQLAAKYAGKRTVPQGKTVLQFPAAHRVFRSTALDFLVVSGNTAWYQGSGTINGAGSYGFLVAASSGGGGAGKVRIRIWDKASGAVVYDSQPGAPLNAAPATVISHGRIALHVKQKHKRTAAAGLG